MTFPVLSTTSTSSFFGLNPLHHRRPPPRPQPPSPSQPHPPSLPPSGASVCIYFKMRACPFTFGPVRSRNTLSLSSCFPVCLFQSPLALLYIYIYIYFFIFLHSPLPMSSSPSLSRSIRHSIRLWSPWWLMWLAPALQSRGRRGFISRGWRRWRCGFSSARKVCSAEV